MGGKGPTATLGDCRKVLGRAGRVLRRAGWRIAAKSNVVVVVKHSNHRVGVFGQDGDYCPRRAFLWPRKPDPARAAVHWRAREVAVARTCAAAVAAG